MRRRWRIGALTAVAVAVAVALQWLPGEPRASRVSRAEANPMQITLSVRSEGLALQIEHGGVALTLKM